jgi:hypothetical protein
MTVLKPSPQGRCFSLDLFHGLELNEVGQAGEGGVVDAGLRFAAELFAGLQGFDFQTALGVRTTSRCTGWQMAAETEAGDR